MLHTTSKRNPNARMLTHPTEEELTPYYWLRKLYLAESRNAKDVFHPVIEKILIDMFNIISRLSEYNPEYNDYIDYERSGNEFYSGWSFDSEHCTVVETDDTEKYHPIYLVYHLNPDFKNEYSVDERIDYTSHNDPIYININIEAVKEKDRDVQDTNLLHECIHILQMWYDDKGTVNDQSTAYRYFNSFDYLREKSIKDDFLFIKDEAQAQTHFKHLANLLLLLSNIETEARKEEIDDYVRKYGMKQALETEYMNTNTYIDDFLYKYAHHIEMTILNARTLMANISTLRNKTNVNAYGFKLLCLITSVLVDFGFIKDTRNDDFKDYKQCLLLQDGCFVFTQDVRKKLIETVDFIVKRLNAYIEEIYKEMKIVCDKYGIRNILLHESRRPVYRCTFKLPEKIVPVTEKMLNEEYQSYRELQKRYETGSQFDALVEYLDELHELLVEEYKLKYVEN